MRIQTSAERERARASAVNASMSRDRVLVWAAFAGALWLVAFAVASVLADDSGMSGKIVGDVVYLVPVVAAAGLAAVAAVRTAGPRRRFWCIMTVANTSWLTGDLLWGLLELVLEVEPFPSIADAFYLLGLALVIPAIIVGFGHQRHLRVSRAALDASIVVAATAYAGWTLLIGPQLDYGASVATVVSIAYPLISVATLIVLVSFAFAGHREVPRSIALVSVAVVAGALTNAGYTYLVALKEYQSGNLLNLGWQIEAVVLCLAALVAIRHDEGEARARFFARDLGLPLVLAGLAACFALVAGHAIHGDVHVGSFVLLGYAVVAVVLRLLLTSLDKDRIALELEGALDRQERLAVTDGLTGLHNRRFFEEVLRLEVDRGLRNGDATGLLVIDVDHFKRVNDRHGHIAGDEVLRTVARRLTGAVRDIDIVARYGGEEFVVVLPALRPDHLLDVADRCRRALADIPMDVDGTPVTITVSVGAASVPAQARNVEELVRVADRALYRAKESGRNTVHVGATSDPADGLDVSDWTGVMEFLHNLADEIDARQSSDDHSRAMCAWAADLAERLGLDADATWRAVTAARFHDIGKVRVPDAVLAKTEPLDDADWRLIRQHPAEGARILSLTPDLADVAPIVAQHHERWDGGGYPAGVAGADIRIEARIISVCDAWSAMLANRRYRPALTPAAAHLELLNGSGTQFDPQVVDAFLAMRPAAAFATPAPAADAR